MRLDRSDHRALVLWAADCAEHVLPFFEDKYPNDDRPRNAIEAGRAWARGELTMAELRAAALAAHAAARTAADPAARAAARAAGHAAATAHVATHAPHAAGYAATAAAAHAAADAAVTPDAARAASADERARQLRHLPEHLQPVGLPDRSKG